MEKIVSQRRCFLLGDEGAETLLLQPVDSRGSRSFSKEAEAIRSLAPDRSFLLCGFPVENWSDELSPWTAPPAFGGSGFGGRAGETLRFVTEDLIPALGTGKRVFLGGYSMAGLFSLWAGAEYDGFAGIAGVSPSVWFTGWRAYARQKPLRAGAVYLSLGVKEENTKTPGNSPSGECIRELAESLSAAGTPHILEWNPGGHFSDPTGRTARAFAWLLNR